MTEDFVAAYAWGDTVGRCIYCGSTDDLRDEHVIPYGLNGVWVLRDASCGDCAKITSRFELEVLRKAFLAPRSVLGFKTRRKKERPSVLPLQIDRGSGLEEIQLPLSEHPGLAVFPRFELPAWLQGQRRQAGINVVGSNLVHFGRLSPFDFHSRLGGKKLSVTVTYSPTELARMIGKIALGVAVARFGLDAVKNAYPLPAILGHTDDVGTWVGSTEPETLTLSPAPDGRITHLVATDIIRGDIVVYVRLFAWAVPDEYVVVLAPAPRGHTDSHAHGRQLGFAAS